METCSWLVKGNCQSMTSSMLVSPRNCDMSAGHFSCLLFCMPSLFLLVFKLSCTHRHVEIACKGLLSFDTVIRLTMQSFLQCNLFEAVMILAVILLALSFLATWPSFSHISTNSFSFTLYLSESELSKMAVRMKSHG